MIIHSCYSNFDYSQFAAALISVDKEVKGLVSSTTRHEEGQKAVDTLHDSEHYTNSKHLKVLVHTDLFLVTCVSYRTWVVSSVRFFEIIEMRPMDAALFAQRTGYGRRDLDGWPKSDESGFTDRFTDRYFLTVNQAN